MDTAKVHRADVRKEKIAFDSLPYPQAKAAECDAELKQIGKELDTITIKGADIQKTRQELLAERRAKEKAVRSSQAQMKAISREIHDKKKEKIALERKRDECIAT